MDTITEKLKQIYKKKGYLDHYGGSVFITFITLLVFFVLISYYHVMNNIKPIKADWVTQRCNPSVIPFAGLINKNPGSSTIDFTGENFTYCINNILVSIAQDFFKPIDYLMGTFKDASDDMIKDVNSVRKKIADMLGEIADIDSEIMGRILNFLTPLHRMMVKMKDILSKTQASLVTTLYGVITGYLGLHTFVGAFIDILVSFLLMLTAIIVPLLMFFITAPLAIPPMLVYAIVAIYTTVIAVGLSDVMHMTKSSIPPKPRCFDEDTIIIKYGNVKCPIKDIQAGDILGNGAIVTSTFKLSSHRIEMFNLHDVIVSGNHYVLSSEDVWVHVRNVTAAKKVDDYRKEFIYCINTSLKHIYINGVHFTDWDSLDEMDIFDIRRKCQPYLPQIFNRYHFHQYLEGGFIGSTQIELDNGQSVDIKDVEVNDVMRFGERILGKVIIDARDISVQKFTIQKHDFVCGPNNFVIDEDAGIGSILEIKGKPIDDAPDKLYHLLTDSNFIIINGIQFSDYDGCLDHYLNREFRPLKFT